MNIIEIEKLDNGAHRNQEYHGAIPPDWGATAFIREDVSALKNFPFGEVTVEEIDGVSTVTKWVPLPMPEPDPAPDPAPTTEQRVTDLEEAMELLLSGATGETEVAEDEA